MTITPIMLLGAVALLSFAESLFSVAKGAFLKVAVLALFAAPAYMAYSQGGAKLPGLASLLPAQTAEAPRRTEARREPEARQPAYAAPREDALPNAGLRQALPQERYRDLYLESQGAERRQAHGRPVEDEDDAPSYGSGRQMRQNPFERRQGYGGREAYDDRRGDARRIEEWPDPFEEARPRETRRVQINPDDVRAVRRVLDEMRANR